MLTDVLLGRAEGEKEPARVCQNGRQALKLAGWEEGKKNMARLQNKKLLQVDSPSSRILSALDE